MDCGDFAFDLPVWLIRICDGDEIGIECCQFRGQHCLPIFTEEDLIYRFRQQHSFEYFSSRFFKERIFCKIVHLCAVTFERRETLSVCAIIRWLEAWERITDELDAAL